MYSTATSCRGVVVLIAALAAACSAKTADEAALKVIPQPPDLDTALELAQRIEAGLQHWQKGRSELVDYSGEGGEMRFWFDHDTVRKIEATLLGETGQAYWQLYYTSAQKPFYAIYQETRYGERFGIVEAVTRDSFVLLKDQVLHRRDEQQFAAIESNLALSVSPDEVRAFGQQLVDSVHDR